MVKLSPLQLKKNLEDQTAVTGKKAAFDIQTNVLPKHIKWQAFRFNFMLTFHLINCNLVFYGTIWN